MMRISSLKALLVVVCLVPLRQVAAQSVAPNSLRASSLQLGAVAALGPQASLAADRPPMLVNDPYQHGTRKEGIALMIVGAAGIVTGLIVDEPVVTVLSAGVGGFGLYLYLR